MHRPRKKPKTTTINTWEEARSSSLPPESHETIEIEEEHLFSEFGESDEELLRTASSPIRGRTAEDRKQARKNKGFKKQRHTKANLKSIKEEEKRAADEELERVAEREAEERFEADIQAHVAKGVFFDQLLQMLKDRKYSLADFLHYIFDPATKSAHEWRWNSFFSHRFVVRDILDFWVSPAYPATVHHILNEFCVEQVRTIVNKEAQAITESRELQPAGRSIDRAFFMAFDFDKMRAKFRKHCPTMLQIVEWFSTAKSQLGKPVVGGGGYHTVKQDTANAIMLRAYNQRNTYFAYANSTYCYGIGAPRQLLSIFCSYGLTMNYTSMVQKAKSKNTLPPVPKASHTKDLKPSTRSRTAGIIPRLSMSCRLAARRMAAAGLYAIVYDNINVMFRVSQQILGRKNTQENGTCAAIFGLHKAKLDDMKVADLDAAYQSAPELGIQDILFDKDEAELWNKCMVSAITRIIVNHGGQEFEKWKKDALKHTPRSNEVIEVHQTEVHPLPSMDIEEASIKGNIEVMEAIGKEIERPISSTLATFVSFVCGDQLTIARNRTIAFIRSGHEVGLNAWRHFVLLLGLFHTKMADNHGVLETHFGKPGAGARNPTSLCFHNTVLDRLPIVLTSLPNFRTCRDLIFTSLYGRVLHCLLLVSGFRSLDDYAKNISSIDTIEDHARQIYQKFAKPAVIEDGRGRRWLEEQKVSSTEANPAAKSTRGQKKKSTGKLSDIPAETPKPPFVGDAVFENAVLFIRDALVTREFSDAIKCGDSGRVILCLKRFALSFRANGRTKYAHEMLHLIHNLTHVWPKPLRSIILNNWLVNLTGRPNAFVEVDLMQEHLVYWVKKIFKADGDAHSWSWLRMISPCIDVIRQIAHVFQERLGSRQGTKHTNPDLSRDISSIMNSLHQHGVYKYREGRSIDEDDKIIPDVISEGLSKLVAPSSSNPLAEYNTRFRVAKQRREMVTVSELEGIASFLDTMSLDSLQGLEGDEDHIEMSNGLATTGVDMEVDHEVGSDNETEEAALQDESGKDERYDDEDTLRLEDEEDVELDMDGYDDIVEEIEKEDDWEDEEEFTLS